MISGYLCQETAQATTTDTVQLEDLKCDQSNYWSHKVLVTIEADSLPKSTQPL